MEHSIRILMVHNRRLLAALPREAYAVRHTVCSVHVRRTYNIIVCYPRDSMFGRHILFECALCNGDDVDFIGNGKL